jgi:hypothetical protein
VEIGKRQGVVRFVSLILLRYLSWQRRVYLAEKPQMSANPTNLRFQQKFYSLPFSPENSPLTPNFLVISSIVGKIDKRAEVMTLT